MMNPSQYLGLTRIDKKTYNKLHKLELDTPIIITANKVSPYSTMAFHTTVCAEKRNPNRLLNEFYYYNCNAECGNTVHIYITDENYKALIEQGVISA